MENTPNIVDKVRDALINAASTFRSDQKDAYLRAINKETNPVAKWVLESMLENSVIAANCRTPLCDDTGIPHLFLELGPKRCITGEFIESIYEGVREGLRLLPGRPMAINGNDIQRIDQSGGINDNPIAVSPAPLLLKRVNEDVTRLTILMLGGGPAIRAKTYRVFHKHDVNNVEAEIVRWAVDAVGKLGCTPAVLCVGIGRSHFEASSMMIEAMVNGDFNVQNELEAEITRKINETRIGPLGLGGETTVLATFLKVGPQRASGVRIVCVRPCCCIEPRKYTVNL